MPGLKWDRIGWGLAGLLCLTMVTAAVVYARYEGYVDHGESAISAVAWLILKGHPAYLPLSAPDIITNVYGPLTYLWHAWPLTVFGPSVPNSKIAAALAGILIGPALYLVGRRSGPLTGWFLAIALGILTLNIAFSVVIRPDALVILMVAAGVLCVGTGDRWGWRTTLALGLLAGFLVNVKVHGFIYLAPIGLFHVWGRWGRLPVATAAAVAAAGSMFLLPPFSLTEYLAWFGPAAHKANNWRSGWLWEVLVYFLPFLMLPLGPRTRLETPLKMYLGGYGLCLILMLFPATKIGAGSHYFYPFLPIMLDLLRRLAPSVPSRAQAGLATTLALLVAGTSYQAERRFYKKQEWDKSSDVVAEIGSWLDRYKDKRVQMGVGHVQATDVGDHLSYHYYAWRNLPVYRGHPYTLDAGILMEMANSAMPFPQEADRRLATCHTQVWLMPKDAEPFRLKGYYNTATNPQEAFPSHARETFLAHHAKVATGTYFDIWECSP